MERTYRSMLLRTVHPPSPTLEAAVPTQVTPEKSHSFTNFFRKANPAQDERSDTVFADSILADHNEVPVLDFTTNEDSKGRRASGQTTLSTTDAGRIRSAAYAAVILSEFAQELAAIAQERVLLSLLHDS